MHYLDLIPKLVIPEITKASMLSANIVNAQGGKWGKAGAGLHEKPMIPQDLVELGVIMAASFVMMVLPGLLMSIEIERRHTK